MYPGAFLGLFGYRLCDHVVEKGLNTCPAYETPNCSTYCSTAVRVVVPDINWWHGQPALVGQGFSRMPCSLCYARSWNIITPLRLLGCVS